MKWLDITDIVLALEECYPDVDILSLRFVELHTMIYSLDGFNDEKENSNEKILEAIQMEWLEERQD